MLWMLRAPRTAPSAKQAKTSKSELKTDCPHRWLPAAGLGDALSFCHFVMAHLGAELAIIFMVFFGTPDPMTGSWGSWGETRRKFIGFSGPRAP